MCVKCIIPEFALQGLLSYVPIRFHGIEKYIWERDFQLCNQTLAIPRLYTKLKVNHNPPHHHLQLLPYCSTALNITTY